MSRDNSTMDSSRFSITDIHSQIYQVLVVQQQGDPRVMGFLPSIHENRSPSCHSQILGKDAVNKAVQVKREIKCRLLFSIPRSALLVLKLALDRHNIWGLDKDESGGQTSDDLPVCREKDRSSELWTS